MTGTPLIDDLTYKFNDIRRKAVPETCDGALPGAWRRNRAAISRPIETAACTARVLRQFVA